MSHAVDEEDALVEMAGSLIAPMMAIRTSAEQMKTSLRCGESDVPLERLDEVIEHAGYAVDVLRDLARAGDPEVVNALEALRAAEVVALEAIRVAAHDAARVADAAALESLRLAALDALRIADVERPAPDGRPTALESG